MLPFGGQINAAAALSSGDDDETNNTAAEDAETGDEALPLLSSSGGSGGKLTPRKVVSKPPVIVNRGRRQSAVAGIGLGGLEFSLPGGTRIGSIDSSNRATSLTAIGQQALSNPLASALQNAAASMASAIVNTSSSQNTLLQQQNLNNSQTSSRSNLGTSREAGLGDSETQLYDTLIKSLHKRRQSAAKMNSTAASLLMNAAPTVLSATAATAQSGKTPKTVAVPDGNKKSVCFADFVRTSDGNVLGDGEYDYDYDYDDAEDEEMRRKQAEAEEEELLDEEEKRKRTLERMKRKKEDATTNRLRKYGYDPLNPPTPRSWAEWSMQRRDYQAALAEVLQCQKQPQLSTAAMKGRKDSVAFVKEELIDVHLNKKQNDNSLLGKKTESSTTDKEKNDKKLKDKKANKGAAHNRHHQAQLSDAEMEILKAYYYHGIFSGARALAVIANLIAMALIAFAIVLPFWIRIPYKEEPLGAEYLYQLTMFENCTVLLKYADHSLLADLRDLAEDVKEVVDHGSFAALGHSVNFDRPPLSPVPSSVPSISAVPSVRSARQVELTASSGEEELIGLTQETSAETSSQRPKPTSQSNIAKDEEIVEKATTAELIPEQSPFSNHSSMIGSCEKYSLGTWQTFLIGVFSFAWMFGWISLFFSIAGGCSGNLPKSLYYYHSAAEMLFVSAFLTGAAALGFPLCARYKAEILKFFYGHGFFTALVSAVCYLISASLLNLDIFIMYSVPAKETKRRKR